jgi:hypothetical protein
MIIVQLDNKMSVIINEPVMNQFFKSVSYKLWRAG